MDIENNYAAVGECEYTFKEVFDGLESVFLAHSIKKDEYAEIKRRIFDFKFAVPLVGVFSSGKSSFVNALLGESLLPTDITPETSFPVEITYGDIKKFIAHDLERSKSIDVSEESINKNTWAELLFKNNAGENKNNHSDDEEKADVKRDICLKIEYPSSNIRGLERIRLLDMPGIDSSHADHDKVISRNVKEAIAYIIVVSVDEGTLKSSLQRIMQELAANQVPCAILITKTDKHESSKVDQVISHVKKEFVGLIGHDPVFIAPVSARKQHIDLAVEGVRNLDKLAEYAYQKKVISPFCVRLQEIHQAISNNLEYSRLEMREIESKIGEINEAIDRSKKVVEGAVEKFEGFLVSNIDAIADIVLEEVRHTEKNLVSLIVVKNDKAKMEIEDAIQTAVRIGMLSATEKIIEPAYRELCSEISGTLSRAGGQITIGENLSFDIVNDVGMSEISLSKAALWTGIGGLLLATVFPLVGIAVGVISLAASLFFKNKEEKDGGDKKRSAAKKQVREFFATLQEQLEKDLPVILINKVGEIKNILTQELRQKLKGMQTQVLELKKHVEENSIDKYCAMLQIQHEKTNHALLEVRKIFAPGKALLVLSGENPLDIEINFESFSLRLEPADIKSSVFIAPVFNKIFFILLDTVSKESSALFKIKLPSLRRYALSQFFNGGVEIFYEKNKIQSNSLFSVREKKLIQNGISLVYINHSKVELIELLSVSKSLMQRSLDGQESDVCVALSALYEAYEQVIEKAIASQVEDISSIKIESSIFDCLGKVSQCVNDSVDYFGLLAARKVKAKTVFGTSSFFNELHDNVINFNSAVSIALSCIAAMEAKSGLSVVCSDLRRQDGAGRSLHELLSTIKDHAFLFRTSVIEQSNTVNSLFNRKETLDKRKKELALLVGEHFNSMSNNIEKIENLINSDFSIRVQFSDCNSIHEI